MGGFGELADLLTLHTGNVDHQRYDQAKRLAVWADADLRGHRGVAQRHVLLASDQAERAVEAGGVARGKELLGIGPVTAAAASDCKRPRRRGWYWRTGPS